MLFAWSGPEMRTRNGVSVSSGAHKRRCVWGVRALVFFAFLGFRVQARSDVYGSFGYTNAVTRMKVSVVHTRDDVDELFVCMSCVCAHTRRCGRVVWVHICGDVNDSIGCAQALNSTCAGALSLDTAGAA